jgi:hypothetical protein
VVVANVAKLDLQWSTIINIATKTKIKIGKKGYEMSMSLPRRSTYLDCGGVGDDGGDDGDSMRNIKICLYAYLFT